MKKMCLLLSFILIATFLTAQTETEIQDIGNDGQVTLKMTTENPDPRELRLGFDLNTKQAILGTISQTDLSFYTANQERMRVTYDGEVGIGTSGPSQDLHIAGNGAGNTILRISHDDSNAPIGSASREIGIELFSDESSASISSQDWRIMNKNTGLEFERALDEVNFDRMLRMSVSGDNKYSFFSTNIGIHTFPSRALDVFEDSDDLIARFTQASQGAVGLELVRQSGNSNTTNRDWQILNDNNGIFSLSQSSTGSNYNIEFRVSPTVTSVDTDFRPLQDNTFDLGSSTSRWDNVFATNPIIVTSDLREKKTIKPIEYGLETLTQLNPVSYYWKSGSSDKKLGLIAQEVVRLIPEAVNIPDKENELYGISYIELVPVLIQSIQDLNQIIENQEKRLKILESK